MTAKIGQPPRTGALASMVDVIVFDLNRFDFTGAEMTCNAMLKHQALMALVTPLEVMRAAAVRNAALRGLESIKRRAQVSAKAEFYSVMSLLTTR